MRELPELFANNRQWAAGKIARDPQFFSKLAAQQAPRYLWIGCSDSRVPANQIVGLDPGELFVHRNVANLVKPEDANCLAVLEYAIGVLGVEHVIVCGHLGCGGIQAAFQGLVGGAVGEWLSTVRTVIDTHRVLLESEGSKNPLDLLCRLNVIEQAAAVATSLPVAAAWSRNRKVAIHAWVYALEDGLLQDLQFTVRNSSEVAENRVTAIAQARVLTG